MINATGREDLEIRRTKQKLHVKELFINFLVDMEFYQCTFLCFIFFQYPKFKLPLYVTFILLIIHQLILLIKIIYKKNKEQFPLEPEYKNYVNYNYFRNMQIKIRLKQELIERLYLISFITILVIIYYINATTNVILLVPSILTLITRLRIYCMESKEVECLNVTNFFFLSCRLFLLIACLSISIKLDGYVDWSWRQTLWFFWVFLSILVGVVFGMIIMITSKCVQFCLQEQPTHTKCYESKTDQIFIMVCRNFYCFYYYNIYLDVRYHKLFRQQPSLNITQNEPFKLCICIVIGHMMFTTFMTYIWYKDLIQMLYSLIYIDNDNQNDPNQLSPVANQVSRFGTKKVNEENIKQTPKILQKISSTYFSVNSSQAQRNLSSNIHSERTQITHQRNNSQMSPFLSNKKTQIVLSIGDKDDKKPKEYQEQDKINEQYLEEFPENEQYKQKPSNNEINIQEGSELSLQQCLICFDKIPNSVYMPCGHGGICYECGLSAWKKKDECFLCRNKINQLLEIEVAKKGEVVQVISTTKPHKLKFQQNL